MVSISGFIFSLSLKLTVNHISGIDGFPHFHIQNSTKVRLLLRKVVIFSTFFIIIVFVIIIILIITISIIELFTVGI